MKCITLEKVLWSMEEMEPNIEIPEDVRQQASLAAVERMLALVVRSRQEADCSGQKTEGRLQNSWLLNC